MKTKTRQDTEIKLKIADILIRINSGFALDCKEDEQNKFLRERFNNFLYNGHGKPDIEIRVNVVKRLPGYPYAKDIFITYHPEDKEENWRLQRIGGSYIYKCPLKNKLQVMMINKHFDRVSAYLSPIQGKAVWDISDIIYDFLHVLLINYLALNNKGIFMHAIGVRDINSHGLLFAGRSGAGKSTLARLWHAHSKGSVLNDDRIIVRKIKGKFLIYGSPWHGDFRDYLSCRVGTAPLKKIFFIYHAPRNVARKVPKDVALRFLYPVFFLPFWDRRFLNNVSLFCQGLIKEVDMLRLGFVKDRKIIDFARRQ